MNNDSEILGEWANQGYFLLDCYDDTAIYYKDDGKKSCLAIFHRSLLTPELCDGVCQRHHETLVGVDI